MTESAIREALEKLGQMEREQGVREVVAWLRKQANLNRAANRQDDATREWTRRYEQFAKFIEAEFLEGK